jgi:ribosome-associated translation inhibitor RaiA
METLYFALGVLTVLALVGVVGLLMVWKKAAEAAKENESLWDGIDSLANDLAKEVENIHRRLDSELQSVEHNCSSIDKNLDGKVEEIYRTLDSRLDKLEKRLTKIFEDGCKPVQEK